MTEVNMYIEKNDGGHRTVFINDDIKHFTGFTLTKNDDGLKLVEDQYAGSRLVYIEPGDRLVIEIN